MAVAAERSMLPTRALLEFGGQHIGCGKFQSSWAQSNSVSVSPFHQTDFTKWIPSVSVRACVYIICLHVRNKF